MKLGLTDKFFPCSNLFPCASVLSLSCHALQSCEPSSIHSGVTHFNQRFLLVTDIAPEALVSLWVLYSPPMETKATSKSTQRTNARVCRPSLFYFCGQNSLTCLHLTKNRCWKTTACPIWVSMKAKETRETRDMDMEERKCRTAILMKGTTNTASGTVKEYTGRERKISLESYLAAFKSCSFA